MKKIITSTVLVLLAIFFLSACKKSNKQQTTLEKIQGVWQLETEIYNKHISGQDNITTITGAPGDIFDFRTDGNLYVEIGGDKDTFSYSLSGDTKILIGFYQDYDITTLTTNSFIFYEKTITGASDFDELTVTLKK